MAKAKAKTNGEEVALPLEARVIQCIADFPAPRTTQDQVDVMAAEYATASLLRQYAEKRFDTIKKNLIDEYGVEIAKIRNEAVEKMIRTTDIVNGVDWSISFAANSPATKLDPVVFKTELVRRGVNVKLIDEAETVAIKKSTPALIITAKR